MEYVTIDRDYDMSISHIELKDNDRSMNIVPKEQLEVENNRKTYTIELMNSDISSGKYETYIHVKIGDKDYSRQVWCVDKSSKYLDAVNNISLDIDKNRLTITKI